MRINTISLIILALLAGCDLFAPIDPCAEGSPLQQDPKVAADCQACNQSPCPDETDETGDDTGDVLTCSTDLDGERHGALYCFVGQWAAAQVGEAEGQIVHIDAADCRTLSTNTFDCNRSWSDPGEPDSGPSECVLCDVFVGGLEQIGGPHYDDPWPELAPRTVDFGLCSYSGTYGSGWDGWGHEIADAEALAESWDQPLGCPDHIDSTPPPFVCDVVQIHEEPGPTNGWAANEAGENWTCKCLDHTDDSCQPGAVCELGWVFENGLPHPTLCTWDQGQPAPAGPEVYGLTTWSDGLNVDGDSVEISSSMLLAMLPREGQPAALFNDDQRFDARGTVIHCGVESLCAYLGLRVGDTPQVSRTSIEDLLSTGMTRIEIVRPRLSSRWLSVTID